MVGGGGATPPLLAYLNAERPLLPSAIVAYFSPCRKKVDVRRPVHLIITLIKWIRTSRLSIKNSLTHRPRPLLPSAIVAYFRPCHARTHAKISDGAFPTVT